jgi:hypothetical protein
MRGGALLAPLKVQLVEGADLVAAEAQSIM